MTQDITYSKEYSVYPGEYIPVSRVNALLNELKFTGKDSATWPLINMDEFEDCFKIEAMVPGVKREDIITLVEDNILCIVVLNNNQPEPGNEKLQIHEFDTACLQRHIILPGNADAEFISAEYKHGMLSIYIPKAHEPLKYVKHQIAIY